MKRLRDAEGCDTKTKGSLRRVIYINRLFAERRIRMNL